MKHSLTRILIGFTLLALAFSGLGVTPAYAAPILTCNPAAITINDAAVASPYPSTITLTGLDTALIDVNVQLLGLSHTFPDDLDMLLVGPQGQNLMIMSDVGGGTDVSAIDLILDDSAAPALPNATVLSTGTYRPANYTGGTDTFPAPAPVPSVATTLATFNGTDPNGIWSLYILDDNGVDAGSLASGWCLEVDASPKAITAFTFPTSTSTTITESAHTIVVTVPFGTDVTALVASFTTSGASVAVGATPQVSGTTANDFSSPVTYTVTAADSSTQDYEVTVVADCSPTAITINDDAVASPYPSTITLAGLGAALTDVNVHLLGLSHTFPSDINMLLVGPQGQNLEIMAEVGGGTDVSLIDLILDDSAAQPLPSGPLSSGSYSPMNYAGGPNPYPAPAPATSVATTLATFNGTDPNGTWSLYILDTFADDAGSLASGWCLDVDAPSPAKAITTFTFPTSTGTTITEAAHTIAVTVPFGTDVTALVASFTTTGSSVAVGATPQVSGTTANDFSSSVTYTVTAADSSTQDYEVTVTVAADPAKAITAFTFPTSTGMTITEAVHTIAVTVPFGTDVTALVASFTTTGASVAVGATPQVSGTTANDFSGPVTYTVTAADSSTQDYEVTVTVAAGDDSDPSLIYNQSYAIQYDTQLGVLDTNAALTFASGYRKAKSGSFTINPIVVFTKITWISYRGPDQGKARVYVDGVLKKTVDLYSPTPQWQYFVEIKNLTNGTHTVVIKPMNARNVASSDNWVVTDGFNIGGIFYDDDYIGVSGFSRYGSWIGLRDNGSRFKAYRISSVKNATMKFSFDGEEFTWITARGPAYGKAEIWVDGVRLKTVDLYRNKQQWQHRITLGALDGLTNGHHNVVIKVLGKKRSASSGTGIVSDGFEITEPN